MSALVLLLAAAWGGAACSVMFDDGPLTGGPAAEKCSASKPCADDGNPCTTDACVDGTCRHAALQPGTPCSTSGVCDANGKCAPGCGVDNRFYQPGSAASDNACEVCDTSSTRTALTPVADDTPCDDDGNPCTRDFCASGVCVHAQEAAGTSCGGDSTCNLESACSSACFIDERFVDPGVLNPDNPCEACDPSTSTTDWTTLPDKTACPADGDSCTVDECKAGACVHPKAPSGTKCGGGACLLGLCTAVCFIGGKQPHEGERDPSDPCRTCQTTVTNKDWSPVPDGTSCGAESCGSYGACQFAGACAVNGQKTRTCTDPTCTGGSCAAAKHDETAACTRPSTDGATCDDDANPCTGDVCAGGGCTHPDLAPGTDCGEGKICDGNGACLVGCYVDGAFYADGAKNPANACQVCDAASWTSGWSSGSC